MHGQQNDKKLHKNAQVQLLVTIFKISQCFMLLNLNVKIFELLKLSFLQ